MVLKVNSNLYLGELALYKPGRRNAALGELFRISYVILEAVVGGVFNPDPDGSSQGG